MKITSLLIAQRGEIAVRIIHACREMGIRAAAVYSDADAGALHVRMADAAVPIGPSEPAQSYLRGDRIIAAARSTGCDAIHPGYGFLSENADFAAAVLDAGLLWVGPQPDSMRAMGDKTQARETMRAAGVPVIPGWAPGDADIQYPVMVKAAAGGGGKGMRRVHAASELPEAIGAAQREAASSFGDERVYLEKYIRAARHVEFQILGDAQGNVIHLYERECSIQRRHQKIVEETPSPYLDAALRERMAAAAVTAARAVNYIGAGTVEFIVDAETRDYYFLEMNTRLQVEHPITEMTTGIDLVQAQLRIANGEPLWLQQPDVVQRGHALECRLYAEDPAHDFLPAAGRVLAMETPRGPGVRVDTGIEHGDAVSVHYDPLIAKLIVHAKDRPAALRRMAAALRATAVLGVPTNVAFLQDVVAHPTFVDGAYTTAFVEEQLPGWLPTPAEISPAFALVAALAELTRTPARSAHDAGRATPWDRADGFRMGV